MPSNIHSDSIHVTIHNDVLELYKDKKIYIANLTRTETDSKKEKSPSPWPDVPAGICPDALAAL